jgi:uncharacterized protein (TIGR00159 family)
MILFLTFRWIDAVDILLAAMLLFQFYRLVRGTVAIQILMGIITVYLSWKIVEALQMELLSEIFGWFLGVGAIAILIVFQQELRRFLLYIGTTAPFAKNRGRRSFFSFSFKKSVPVDMTAIIRACNNLSEAKTGALIVITNQSTLSFYAGTGDPVDAKVTSRIIESIFYKNSPLHDGAVIITGNRIVAARCVMPVTENAGFPAHLGMRHRAAAGITENSDAVAIVVSEQTGDVSMAYEGKIQYAVNLGSLKQMVEEKLK